MLAYDDIPLLPSRIRYYASTLARMSRGLSPSSWITVAKTALGMQSSASVRLQSGEQFRVRSPMDIWCVVETWLNGIYEDRAVVSSKPTVVLDIGGGVGDFSVRATRIFPEAKVIVFEPHPVSAAVLKENIALNKCSAIQVNELAVSGGVREIRLYSPAARTALDSSVVRKGGMEEKASIIPAIPLAEVLRSLHNERVFLKLDAEGIEYELFRSLEEQDWRCLAAVAMEYHEFTPEMKASELIETLERYGLRTHRVRSPAHANIGYLYATRAA